MNIQIFGRHILIILDFLNDYRWNSTFFMLKVFKDHYCLFCEEYGSVNDALFVFDDTWTLIDEIVMCLEPCSAACIKLQRQNLLLTDVYKIFNICQMELSEIGTHIYSYTSFISVNKVAYTLVKSWKSKLVKK